MTATSTASAAPAKATYSDVFSNGEFRALFAAQVISVLGNVVAQVSLAVLIYERTGSPLLSALTFTLGMVPYLIAGTALAGIVDRLPTRRTMLSCDLISAVTVGIMVLPLPIPALLALVGIVGLTEPVFAGVRTAVLPEMLGTGPTFVLGRSLFSMVWQGAQVIGYACGALLLALVGIRGSLSIDAGSFLGSALLVGLGTRDRTPSTGATAGRVRDAFGNVREVMSDPWARQLLLLHWIIPACALAPEALIAAYTKLLHRPEHETGLLLSVLAAGMLVANLLVGRLMSSRNQRRSMIPIVMLQCLALLALIAPLSFGVTVALLVVIGAGYCWSLGRDSYLIDSVPLELRARMLVVDQTGVMVTQGFGFAIWGAVAEWVPLRATIGIAGAIALATVVWFAVRARQLEIDSEDEAATR